MEAAVYLAGKIFVHGGVFAVFLHRIRAFEHSDQLCDHGGGSAKCEAGERILVFDKKVGAAVELDGGVHVSKKGVPAVVQHVLKQAGHRSPASHFQAHPVHLHGLFIVGELFHRAVPGGKGQKLWKEQRHGLVDLSHVVLCGQDCQDCRLWFQHSPFLADHGGFSRFNFNQALFFQGV